MEHKINQVIRNQLSNWKQWRESKAIEKRYIRETSPPPPGIEIPDKCGYIHYKAWRYLSVGPAKYREGDFFHFPPKEWSREQLGHVLRVCEQIVRWRGLSAESPLEDIGSFGFYALLHVFHFKLKQQSEFDFKDGTIIDKMEMQHVMNSQAITLYNHDTGRTEELTDLDRLGIALELLDSGIPETAKVILKQVIGNTPVDYSHQREEGDKLLIDFWDEGAFLHYATWQDKQSISRNVVWIENVYPRAYFYLGFLAYEAKEFETAIEYLSRGEVLEPTNPEFKFEMALCYVGLRELAKALELYASVDSMGPHCTAAALGRAQRGRGFVLLEMGRNDEAEVAYKQSLQFEPENEVALSQLKYIEDLRTGSDVRKSRVGVFRMNALL